MLDHFQEFLGEQNLPMDSRRRKPVPHAWEVVDTFGPLDATMNMLGSSSASLPPLSNEEMAKRDVSEAEKKGKVERRNNPKRRKPWV